MQTFTRFSLSCVCLLFLILVTLWPSSTAETDFAALLEQAKNASGDASEETKKLAGDVINSASNAVNNTKNSTGDAIDGAKNAFGDAANATSGAVNGTTDALNDAKDAAGKAINDAQQDTKGSAAPGPSGKKGDDDASAAPDGASDAAGKAVNDGASDAAGKDVNDGASDAAGKGDHEGEQGSNGARGLLYGQRPLVLVFFALGWSACALF